ncbi:MAG: CHASE3 domain-containing protein [Rhodospirillales bacterium]
MAIHVARDDEDEYDTASTGFGDKTFLGGLSLGARSWLYFLACLIAAAAFGALYYHVDQRLDQALQNLQRAARIDELANTVERGTYSLQARQRKFLLTRDTEIAAGFSADLADVSAALDELFSYPEAQPLAQHVTTIRDGLVQYDQQFQTFLNAEREIGAGTDDGLSAQLRRTSANLRAAFRDSGNANLINQVERIDQQGEETILSGSKKGVEEIRKRYEALHAFVDAANLDDQQKARIDDLLKRHETQMLSIINARFELADQTRRFEELFDYFVPSLTGLAGFSERLRIQAAAEVRNMQLFARYTIVGGSMAIVLWLFFFGLLLIKSLSGPAKRIADATERIARGASHVSVPAQGNKDDFGRIARMLDGWADTIIEADQLRNDLERTRDRLNQTIGDADEAATRAHAAEQRADRAERKLEEVPKALPAPEPPPEPEPAPEPEMAEEPQPRRQRQRPIPALDIGDVSQGGPISSVSQQLQNFTQYVTAAANDVERTEALIKGIDQMTVLVDDISELVMTIRDQSNLLAFRSPGKEAARDAERDGDDNLVAFSSDRRATEADRVYAQRFDHLREATDQTERTAHRIKNTLENVSTIAREIAETASHQALDATHRLLNQSEYLQNMLDDILNRVHPAKPGALSEKREPRRSNDDPFA